MTATSTGPLAKMLRIRTVLHGDLLLFGLLRIGYSDLTLLELTPGDGFVEQVLRANFGDAGVDSAA